MRQAVLTFLLGRAGVFENADAETRYVNQLRMGGALFEHLQSKRCGAAQTTMIPLLVPVASCSGSSPHHLPCHSAVEQLQKGSRSSSCNACLPCDRLHPDTARAVSARFSIPSLKPDQEEVILR